MAEQGTLKSQLSTKLSTKIERKDGDAHPPSEPDNATAPESQGGAAGTAFVRPRGLVAKLAAIAGEVGRIEKRGHNDFHHYDYLMAADVNHVLAELFAKYGVFMLAEEESLEWGEREGKNETAMFVCRAQMRYRFLDGDNEDNPGLTFHSTGEAMDTGDKVIYKAKTGALKYALIQNFLISAGDDPEAETEKQELKAGPNASSRVEAAIEGVQCPQCGKTGTIIKGSPQYGGGFVCWKKRQGCGAKFAELPGSKAKGPTIGVEAVAELREYCMEFETDEGDILAQLEKRYQVTGLKDLSEITAEMGTWVKGVFEKKKAEKAKEGAAQ